jgi:septation ring formation regulator EzrA
VALDEELLLLVFVVNDETSNLIMLRLVGFTKVVFERLSVEWNDRSLSL